MKPVFTTAARVATRRPQQRTFTFWSNANHHSSEAASRSAYHHRSWFWRSLLGGVGLVGAATAASAVTRCDDSLIDDLARLESKLTLENPGEYKDLDQMKKIDVDEGEGLQALLTTVISSGEDMNFMLQHSMAVCGGPTDHYMCTVIADGKPTSATCVIQPTPEGTVLQTILRRTLSARSSLQGHFLFQGPQISAMRSELKFSGPDFTAVGQLALGQRLGGTGAGFTYFQAVTKQLALGGDVMFLTNDLVSVGAVAYSLYGAWQKNDYALLAKYDRTHNDVTVRYWRSVTDKLRLGTSMNVNLEKMEANWDVSYEMPIRLEDGVFPYTTLRGKVNMRSLKMVTSIDHTLLNGQGVASVMLSMDHFKEDYKVGVAIKLQA